MSFGKFMLEFRVKHNLTQVQVAEIVGVNKNMIHRYENETSNPTARNKIKFENKMREWEETKKW